MFFTSKTRGFCHLFAFVLVTIAATCSTAPSSSSGSSRTSSIVREQGAPQKYSANCPPETFSGEVNRAEQYEHAFGKDLVFRLLASHDPAIEGWHIEIVGKKALDDGRNQDWAWPLNQPYHGYNAQNVSISYDLTAKDVVEFARKFRFPLNEADAKRATELYEKLESDSGQQLDDAMQELDSFPSGAGDFTITDSRLSPTGPENQKRGRIAWLKFTVSISLPCEPSANKP